MLPHHYSRHFYRISFSRLQNDRNVICQQFIAVEKHTFCFWRMYNDKMILCCPIAVLCYLFFINFSIYLTKNRKNRIFLKILCKKDNISYFCCNFAADITLLYNNWIFACGEVQFLIVNTLSLVFSKYFRNFVAIKYLSLMKYIKGEDRRQYVLFPACLDEYIEQDNPVRYIDAFVDSQDLEELGFNHTKREAPGNGGRPSYDPSDILKLLIYGYFNSIRSSRKFFTTA